MAEIEGEPIKITLDDIEQANKLSESCPMCAGPVYREYNDPAMAPVECASCETIYHRACWEQAGSKCAMVGCDSKQVKAYDAVQPAVSVSIRPTDIRARGPEITEGWVAEKPPFQEMNWLQNLFKMSLGTNLKI